MNYHPPKFRSNLTSKGQVTIPKEIRDALGLKSGDGVAFSLDEDGKARIAPIDDAEMIDQRKAQIMKGVMEARQSFRRNDTMPGMDGLAYQNWIRGPGPEE